MKKLTDICDIQYGYAFDSKCFTEEPLYPPLVRIRDVKRGYSETYYSGDYSEEYLITSGDLLIGMDGEFNIARWKSDRALLNQRVCKLTAKKGTNEEYLRFAMAKVLKEIEQKTAFVTVKHLSAKELNKLYLNVPELSKQNKIAGILSRLENIIDVRRQELEKLDELIKARFIEMFGDLKKNDKGWKILRFSDFAKIDTKMIHDFEEYQDYPHIGIDSIEKGTGKICGYRTVKEDAVASGKYIFTPEHIIYSKIRPNLNKVALPDFIGVCSADAYPILPIKGKCNRTYLAYVMRDKVFLDYILAFSNRTNLPKVNKKQVEGFSCPIPELNLQKRFEDFVKQVDKSKVSIQKALDETKLLFDSLMQKYFG